MQIGELSKQSGCSNELIRFYEKNGLLEAPRRTSSNYRVYGPDSLKALHFIQRCRAMDLSLEEIKNLMKLKSEEPQDAIKAHEIISSHLSEIEKKLKQLEELKKELQTLSAKCKHHHGCTDNGPCELIDALHS